MSEKHNFDGRILEITDESTASDKAKAITLEVLLEFFKNNSIALLIRNLKVKLVDFDIENEIASIGKKKIARMGQKTRSSRYI